MKTDPRATASNVTAAISTQPNKAVVTADLTFIPNDQTGNSTYEKIKRVTVKVTGQGAIGNEQDFPNTGPQPNQSPATYTHNAVSGPFQSGEKYKFLVTFYYDKVIPDKTKDDVEETA
jgi:hypothetical protein